MRLQNSQPWWKHIHQPSSKGWDSIAEDTNMLFNFTGSYPCSMAIMEEEIERMEEPKGNISIYLTYVVFKYMKSVIATDHIIFLSIT